MIKFGHTILFFFLTFLFSSFAFAQSTLPTVPDVDPWVTIADLIMNWSTLSPLAIAIALVMGTMAVVKKVLPDDNKYKFLITVVLSLAYGFGVAVADGKSYLASAVLIFFTGGGAVFLYEAIKGIWKSTKDAGAKLVHMLAK